MTRLIFETNAPATMIPNDFLSKGVKVLSNSLGKKLLYCVTTVNPGLRMTLGGSNEICGIVQVSSIGSIGPEENKKHTAAITDYIYETVGIPKNKLFVFFQSNTMETSSFLGTTFHELVVVEKGAQLAKLK